MLVIQILIVLFALFAITRVGMKLKDRSLTVGWGVFWLLLWVLVGVIVLLPWTTSLLAARLGVTRGVDLVIYVSVLALFYLFFRMTLKIEKLERTITQVVRTVALKDIEKP